MLMPKTKEPTLQEKNKAINDAIKWGVAGGPKALDLALESKTAEMYGTPPPPATPENIKTTISTAIKLVLDGKIKSPRLKQTLAEQGLNVEDIRTSIVEETLASAIPEIIGKGDVDKLNRIAQMIGESAQGNTPTANQISVQYITIKEQTDINAHIDEFIKNK